jgi:hypothetical protein
MRIKQDTKFILYEESMHTARINVLMGKDGYMELKALLEK